MTRHVQHLWALVANPGILSLGSKGIGALCQSSLSSLNWHHLIEREQKLHVLSVLYLHFYSAHVAYIAHSNNR